MINRTFFAALLVLPIACKGATSSTSDEDAAATLVDAAAGDGATAGDPNDGGTPAADGQPALIVGETAIAGPGGLLEIKIIDPAGAVSAARVNVIGADNAYYEPARADHPLYPYSLARLGMRKDKGPARYYGSPFYTEGTFKVRLPPGNVRIEVYKGFAYYPAIVEGSIVANRKTTGTITLARLVDMPGAGWYTTDTHLHFERPELDDLGLVKFFAGEELNFGHSLAGSGCSTTFRCFVPEGDRYGTETIRTWRDAAIVSGNEQVTGTFGHATQVLMRSLPAGSQEGARINSGPSLAELWKQTMLLGGAMGIAHGGYDMEVMTDVVLRQSDWVELLQFGYFLGVGPQRYYALLNAGFRYPIAGASDFPYSRTLADSRTYVMAGARATFESTIGGLIRGEAFATSGPLLFLSVEGAGPGSQLELPGTAPQKLNVKVRAASAYLPLQEVELVVGGKVDPSGSATFPGLTLGPIEKETTITVDRSTWIAARCRGPQDTRAHTNPVWIYLDGKVPFDLDAANTVKETVDGFSPNGTAEVTETMDRARTLIAEIVAARANQQLPVPNYPRDSTTAPGTSGAVVMPPVLPRPPALPSWSVAGTVVDETGAPVVGATVAVRAAKPSVQTDAKGAFSLTGLPGDNPAFLRVTRSGYLTTNTSYLVHACEGSCVKVVLPKKAAADAWMAARQPTLSPADRLKRAWIAVNTYDAKGALKAGVRPFIANDTTHALLDAGVSPYGAFGFATAAGDLEGTTTAANAKGGIQAVADMLIEFTDGEADRTHPADKDNSVEPNLIVTFPELGKDLVLPVFTGQLSYGVVKEGPVGK